MEQQNGGLIQLLPLAIVTILFAILIIKLAKRKGCSGFWWKVAAFTPGINFYVMWYLIGITDKAVYDKLDEIARALERRTQ